MNAGRRTTRLRPDLIITRDELGDVPVYIVQDPISGDDFEFGEEEYFLIERIGAGESPDLVGAGFRERFGESIARAQIDAFIGRLRLWKLLIDAPAEGRDGPSDEMDELAQDDGDSLPSEPGPDGGVGPTGFAEAKARWQPDRAGVLARPLHYKPIWREPRWIPWLARVLRPIRFLLYLTPILLLVALAVVFYHWPMVEADFERLRKPWNLLEHLLFSLVTVNLMSKVAAGVFCSASGGYVRSFGIHFALGIVPRFHVELGGWDNMERRPMLWTLASPMLAKIVLFSLGVLLWYVTRDGGTQLPMIGYMLASVAALSLTISGNPFGVGDGYALMSGLLQQSNLRGKAFVSLFGRLLPRRRRVQLDPAGLGILRLYGLATIAYILVLLSLIGYFVAIWLETRFQGTGVLLFLLLLVLMLGQVFRRVSGRKTRAAMNGPDARVPSGAAGPRAASANAGGERRRRDQSASSTGRQGSDRPARRMPWGWLVLLLLLGSTFLIPYEYETGGPFTLEAWDRREIYSESPGIVEKVEVNGGQWVEAGTVLAAMSSYRESGEVDSLRAQIERRDAELQRLLTTPRKEEVVLAEKKYEAARVKERFAENEAKRVEALSKDGNVSATAYDAAMQRRDVAVQETLELKASLDLVRQGPHPQEIEAARAELKRLQAELGRQEERLRRTHLVSPMAGRLETLDLDNLAGKYLDDGDLYTAIIDDTVLRAEVEVPESDLPLVAIGDRARLKLWAYPDRIFLGKVVDIEPLVEQETIGRITRVHVRISNDDGRLKVGMTGYGKILGKMESVALAFTHRLVRFFSVEVWSWIP